MKASAILAAVLIVLAGKANAAEFLALQAMKGSNINAAAAQLAVPVAGKAAAMRGEGAEKAQYLPGAYQEPRNSPVYDIWVGGRSICEAHAEHLVPAARAAFEKQYTARLKTAMQKVYRSQRFNNITSVTFLKNEPVNSGAGRTYRINAPGNRDDSTNVTVWHNDAVDSDEMWADSINGIVLQKLDMLKRDVVRPRVVCSLSAGEAYVGDSNDGTGFARFDSPSYVVEMDLDGANMKPVKAANLNVVYTRFYGPME